jgi:hypothetical protein
MDAVTTSIGLAASAISASLTVVTAYLRAGTRRQIAAINADKPEAARIVADAVTSFRLDTSGLDQDQTYAVVCREIEARDRRHARTIWASLSFAVVVAGATVGLSELGATRPSREPSGDTYHDSVHVNSNAGTINFSAAAPSAAGPTPK